MLLGQTKLFDNYKRMRNGKLQTISTTRTLYHLQCDSCVLSFIGLLNNLTNRAVHMFVLTVTKNVLLNHKAVCGVESTSSTPAVVLNFSCRSADHTVHLDLC